MAPFVQIGTSMPSAAAGIGALVTAKNAALETVSVARVTRRRHGPEA